MPMPSDTEIVVNSRGVPPAASTPAFAASTCGPCVMLHGVTSPFWLTTPIIGFAIAASSNPIARMKARCGVRSRPSVVMRERKLGVLPSPLRGGVGGGGGCCTLDRANARPPSLTLPRKGGGNRPGRAASVEDAADLARERIRGERFGQEIDVRIEPAVMDDRIASVAGHVENPNR